MRIKKTPEKFVHCAVCNTDFNNATMYLRHITTNDHQVNSREEDTFQDWLTMYKSRVIVMNGNFRIIPSSSMEISQIPIFKVLDVVSEKCDAAVADIMWSGPQSGFVLLRNQKAADHIASPHTRVGPWGLRVFLDTKNWVDVTAAKNFSDGQWEQMVEDLD